MKFLPLPDSFYEPSARVVAERLLGHWLIRQTPEGACGGPIVETEAYLCDDPACHGFNGETKRNRVMYGPPGRAYVYFIYGNHCCVNAVCRPAGFCEAVLIRAVEPEFGEAMLRTNRPVSERVALTNGPGKLCAAMTIDRGLDGTNLCEPGSSLIVAQNSDLERYRKNRGPVVVTSRVGISKAAEMPLRFYLEGSEFVSRRKRVK